MGWKENKKKHDDYVRSSNMTKHEEAVEKCKVRIKSLQESGCSINAITWLDDTHFHVNWSTKEDVELREKRINEFLTELKEKNARCVGDNSSNILTEVK